MARALRQTPRDRQRDAMKLEPHQDGPGGLKGQDRDIKQNLDDTNRDLDQIRLRDRSLSAGASPSCRRRVPGRALHRPAHPPGHPGHARRRDHRRGTSSCSWAWCRAATATSTRLERSEGNVPLLGTVPDLKSADAGARVHAALSVHHLRNILQLQFERSAGGKVFTITSAAAGDGRPAGHRAGDVLRATGRRTLIVDADLLGRTHPAARNGRNLGAVRRRPSDKVNGDIHATKIPSLWAMPAGRVQALCPSPAPGS